MHEFKRQFPIAPSDWQRKKIGAIADRVTTRNVERHENVLTISAELGLISQSEYFSRRVASASVSNYFLLANGDFAYNKSYSRGYPLGAIRRLDRYEKGCVSPLYICFRPHADEVDSNFFLQYVDGGALDEGLAGVAKEGVRNHGLLNVGVLDFFSLVVSLPPMPEQRKLAQLLDTIDTIIRETEAIIVKLKRVKQGLLYDLLTRGIDSNGELRPPQSRAPHLYKNSPLGWIPNDWDAIQFSELGKYINGNTFDAGAWSSQGLPIIRIQNLNGSSSFNYFEGPVDPRWHVFPGDLLFAWSGQRGVSFGPRIWSGPEGVLNQHIFKVIEEPGVVSKEFLFESLRFRQSVIEDSAHGFKDSFLHVTRGELGAVFAGIPLLPEQSAIVTRIAVFESKLNDECTYLAKTIAMKTGLMDDLLTGRVRVAPLLDPEGTPS